MSTTPTALDGHFANLTNFLFSHTISEVLDGAAFVLIFAAAVQKGVLSWAGGRHSQTAVGADR